MSGQLLPLAGDMPEKSRDRIVPVFKPVFKAKTMQNVKALPPPKALGTAKKSKPKVVQKEAAKQMIKSGTAGILFFFFVQTILHFSNQYFSLNDTKFLKK